jgi:hypothetical protein
VDFLQQVTPEGSITLNSEAGSRHGVTVELDEVRDVVQGRMPEAETRLSVAGRVRDGCRCEGVIGAMVDGVGVAELPVVVRDAFDEAQVEAAFRRHLVEALHLRPHQAAPPVIGMGHYHLQHGGLEGNPGEVEVPGDQAGGGDDLPGGSCLHHHIVVIGCAWVGVHELLARDAFGGADVAGVQRRVFAHVALIADAAQHQPTAQIAPGFSHDPPEGLS